jgi:hypothetical protein
MPGGACNSFVPWHRCALQSDSEKMLSEGIACSGAKCCGWIYERSQRFAMTAQTPPSSGRPTDDIANDILPFVLPTLQDPLRRSKSLQVCLCRPRYPTFDHEEESFPVFVASPISWLRLHCNRTESHKNLSYRALFSLLGVHHIVPRRHEVITLITAPITFVPHRSSCFFDTICRTHNPQSEMCRVSTARSYS